MYRFISSNIIEIEIIDQTKALQVESEKKEIGLVPYQKKKKREIGLVWMVTREEDG